MSKEEPPFVLARCIPPQANYIDIIHEGFSLAHESLCAIVELPNPLLDHDHPWVSAAEQCGAGEDDRKARHYRKWHSDEADH